MTPEHRMRNERLLGLGSDAQDLERFDPWQRVRHFLSEELAVRKDAAFVLEDIAKWHFTRGYVQAMSEMVNICQILSEMAAEAKTALEAEAASNSD